MPSKRDIKRERGMGRSVASDAHLPVEQADEYLFGLIHQADQMSPSIERALVQRGQGVIGIGRFNVSPVGLSFDGELSEDEWKVFFLAVKKITRAIQWIIGDLAAYGKDIFGWTYQDMADLTGYKVSSLYQLSHVAKSVPISIRIETLTFRHHQLVQALPEPRQKEWLTYAAENRLSVRELNAAIQDTPTPPTDDPLGVKSFASRARKVVRVVDRVGQAEKLNPRAAEKALADLAAMRQWIEAAERLIRKRSDETADDK